VLLVRYFQKKHFHGCKDKNNNEELSFNRESILMTKNIMQRPILTQSKSSSNNSKLSINEDQYNYVEIIQQPSDINMVDNPSYGVNHAEGTKNVEEDPAYVSRLDHSEFTVQVEDDPAYWPHSTDNDIKVENDSESSHSQDYSSNTEDDPAYCIGNDPSYDPNSLRDTNQVEDDPSYILNE